MRRTIPDQMCYMIYDYIVYDQIMVYNSEKR